MKTSNLFLRHLIAFSIVFLFFASQIAYSQFNANDKDSLSLIVARAFDVTNSIGTTWHSPLFNVAPDEYHNEWQQSGVKWFRSYIQWRDFEIGSKGNYPVQPYIIKGDTLCKDKLIDHYASLKSHGIEPLVLLCKGNPLYDPEYHEADNTGHLFDPKTPDIDYLSPQGFANFCGEIAKRYKKYIKYYELSNEPYGFIFYRYYGDSSCGANSKWMPHFVTYFNDAATRIKQVYRNANLPPPKILSPGDNNLPAMEAYLPQIAPNVDILAIHPYVWTADGTPELSCARVLQPFLDLARINNIKEVWITEIGWTTQNGISQENQHDIATTEIGQAKYIMRGLFYYPIRYGIKVYSTYCWADGDQQFFVHPTLLRAFRNVKAILGNPVENVPINQYKDMLDSVIFENSAYIHSMVERYLLVKDNKTLYYIYWLRVKQMDNFRKQCVKIFITQPSGVFIDSIGLYDILETAATPVPISFTPRKSGKYLVIEKVDIADYPLLLKIRLK
jgi:hypothetical protein